MIGPPHSFLRPILRILLLFLIQIRPFTLFVGSLNKGSVRIGSNKTLIVLAAPSIWDRNYAEDFVPIVEFQINLVRLLNEFESALLIADRHTIPFINGQNKLLSTHLPAEHLLEATIYDINLHDFAPLGNVQRVKFVYRNENGTSVASRQIDDSINRFLIRSHVRVDKRETEIVLMGKDVVDNGVNRALLSNITFAQNVRRIPKQSLLMKLRNVFRKVVVVPSPVPLMGRRHRLRLDDLLSFVDNNVLVMSVLNPSSANNVHMELFKREKKEVTVIELPFGDQQNEGQSTTGDPHKNDEGNCGLYSAILATERFVFVPVFGNIPTNWQLGYSTKRDKMTVHLIETYKRAFTQGIVPKTFIINYLKIFINPRVFKW